MRRVAQLTVAACLTVGAPAWAQAPSAGRAEELFRVCRACHTIDKDGEDMLGPNLWGVYGSKAAGKPDFYYSDALKNSNMIWTDENLDKWLTSPTKFVPGSKMAYPGIPDAADRAAMITWLKTKKD